MRIAAVRGSWPAANVRWLIWWGYTLLWTAALLVPVPDRPPGIPEDVWSYQIKVLFAKSLHVAAYAVFTMLSGWLGLSVRGRWLMVGFLIGHAASTEFLQWLLPTGRTGCVRDVLLDVLGISIGLVLSRKLWLGSSSGECRPVLHGTPPQPQGQQQRRDQDQDAAVLR